MTGKFLTCETSEGLMDIYVSIPSNSQQSPVVIVLMEAFGVNHHIQSVCDRLAAEGFMAAAPDIYHRFGRKIDVPYSERKDIMPLLGKLTNDGIVKDIRNAINFLEDIPGSDTRTVHTLGFCVGGFSSVLAATKLNIKKMVSFYGGGMVHPREGIGLTPVIDEMKSIKSKCLFFFGGKDASISDEDIKAIESKLESAKVSFEVDIFPLSDHGFFCDERKTYNEQDAKTAWEKTLKFLRE